jgi:4-carboxymuconolactone decarboxylase
MLERPPNLDEGNLGPEQKRIFETIRSGPRGGVQGPLRVWLQSPALAEPAQSLGAFCRFGTSLPPRLSELAIITVGADWRAGFEWHAHAPIAERAGISPAAIEAIRNRTDPGFTREDERAVHAFARELLEARRVSGGTYAALVEQIGLQACVELVGILGYYTLVCMTINAFGVAVPDGAHEPFADPPASR